MSSPDEALTVSSWTLWGVGAMLVVCRLVSRRMSFGSFKYQLDDYLMILTLLTFTGVVVSTNVVASHSSNYAPNSVIATWTDAQVSDAVVGSKMLIGLEQFMLATIWLVKACLLHLYSRLTNGIQESRIVTALAIYCAGGYVLIQILYLGVWCQPIYNYWAVPVPAGHDQCFTYRNHMITVTALNISSDLMMLCVPVPLIIRARLPLKRKIILCVVFSMGIFTVIIAILNRYFNFTNENSLVFLYWYNAEATTAVMIANVPYCWTLLRRAFSLGSWNGLSRESRPVEAPPAAIEAEDARVPRSKTPSIISLDLLQSELMEGSRPRSIA